MGQNASQAIGIACENETDNHDIIGFHLVNKLCWVGAWLRGKGYDVECPNHEYCTANTNSFIYTGLKKPAPPKLEFSYSTTDLTPKTTTESVWLPRLTEKEFKLYSKESYDKKSYVAPQSEKCATTVKLLRPHKLSDDYLDEYLEEKSTENRTVDRDLNILMINNLIICHLNKSPKCDVPHFQLVQETQWGLGWIWEMKCTKCKFISEKYKLFREINTGRPGHKSATINYGFQTGVINCNIGNDSARLLLTSSCIPPMSKRNNAENNK
ncbi:unnamed protein product [Mytilus coruscus]|uniref:Mutator-like transposase domain-containing protein n=1 Tax=Mytilus coruscus TaxID=42192 RepID=A0A6J8AML1_MYTCO|nr:unnamed protein product [Mytilus coruscus]